MINEEIMLRSHPAHDGTGCRERAPRRAPHLSFLSTLMRRLISFTGCSSRTMHLLSSQRWELEGWLRSVHYRLPSFLLLPTSHSRSCTGSIKDPFPGLQRVAALHYAPLKVLFGPTRFDFDWLSLKNSRFFPPPVHPQPKKGEK